MKFIAGRSTLLDRVTIEWIEANGQACVLISRDGAFVIHALGSGRLRAAYDLTLC